MKGKKIVSKVDSMYGTGVTKKHIGAKVRYCLWLDTLSEWSGRAAEAGEVAREQICIGTFMPS